MIAYDNNLLPYDTVREIYLKNIVHLVQLRSVPEHYHSSPQLNETKTLSIYAKNNEEMETHRMK